MSREQVEHRTCDRCGIRATVDELASRTTGWGRVWLRSKLVNFGPEEPKTYSSDIPDLCPACIVHFKDWWEAAKK